MSSILTISWTPPTGQTSTSSTATSYKVAYKAQTDTTYTNITGITGTSVSITGLTNQTYVGYVQTNCSTCTSNTTAAFTGITLDCGISGTAVYYNYIGGTFPPIPTPTPTSTPTPTITPTGANFIGTAYFATGYTNACKGPVIGGGTSVIITGNTNTFCDSIYFTGNTFVYQTSGIYSIMYNNQYMTIHIYSGNTVAEVTGGGCSNCPSYDWYTLENCWDGTTGYTTSFTPGTYVVNDRLTTFLDIGTIWKVIHVSSSDPAPSTTKISVSPSLNYFGAIQQGCPPVFEYFLSDPYDATTNTPFCSSPGKLTGTYIKTFAPTISSFYDYSIYDHSGNLFNGAGNDYNYFIATSSGVNSYTNGSTPLSNERILIKIDNSSGGVAGRVLDISQTTCSGSGGGGGNL
jgi:hypothetical protein